MNAKSIMNIPVFENAATLDFIVSGADEEKAVAAIRDFFQKKHEGESSQKQINCKFLL